LHQWLMEQRRAELDEATEAVASSTAALIQKLNGESTQ